MTVYAIGAIGTGFVKVGFTAGNPKTRMSDLQVGCPYRLVLLGQWVGGEDTEKQAHRALRKIKVRGEWFDFARVDWNKFFAPKLEMVRATKICKSFDMEGLTSFCLALPHSGSSNMLLIILWQAIGSITATESCAKTMKEKFRLVDKVSGVQP